MNQKLEPEKNRSKSWVWALGPSLKFLLCLVGNFPYFGEKPCENNYKFPAKNIKNISSKYLSLIWKLLLYDSDLISKIHTLLVLPNIIVYNKYQFKKQSILNSLASV